MELNIMIIFIEIDGNNETIPSRLPKLGPERNSSLETFESNCFKNCHNSKFEIFHI